MERESIQIYFDTSAIICISLYFFQGYAKYQDFEKIKKENAQFREDLNRQQKEIIQTQQMMIEKQSIFVTFLNKLQSTGTLSNDKAQNIRNIYNETMSVTAKTSANLEDRFLQAIKEAGFVDMKDAALSFDKEHNLLWAIPKTGSYTWDGANEYAKNFNIGGYNNWRLPSASEVRIIINYIKQKESTLEIIKRFKKLGYHSTVKDEPFLNLEENYYWTSESRDSFAKAFHPHTGNTEDFGKDSLKFVVLVRSL